jgi:hypothetical protein
MIKFIGWSADCYTDTQNINIGEITMGGKGGRYDWQLSNGSLPNVYITFSSAIGITSDLMTLW